MQHIKSILEIVHRLQINVIGVKQDKAEELLDYLTNNNSLTEQEVAKRMFPESTQAAYNLNRIKKGLLQRVINTIIARDPGKKQYWDLYFEVGKKDLASNFLWNKERGHAAAKVAQDALKVALKYHFTDHICSLSRRLANHYSVIVSNPGMYRKHKSYYDKHSEILGWEKKAESYYNDLAFHLRQAKTVKAKVVELAKKYAEDLHSQENHLSWTFTFFRLNIDIIIAKFNNDTATIIAICQEALQYLETLPFDLPNRPLRSINFNLVPAYIQSHQLDDASTAINRVKLLIPKTGYNWIAIHQYEAIVNFYLNDLVACTNSITTIKKSKLSARIREEIRIYETYLSFLSGQETRLSTFLNDTPKFSLDKKGMNINRIILQILIPLQKNDRSKIIDRAEALELYAYRHLTKDPTTRRSQLFLRLLFLTVRHSFDWEVIERQTAKTLAELKQTPRHLSTIDIEVVPYEVLWGKVQELLVGNGS